MNPYAKARTDAGLSVRKAAKAIGVAATTVVAWENHGVEPRPKHLRRAIEIYGSSFDQLAGHQPLDRAV